MSKEQEGTKMSKEQEVETISKTIDERSSITDVSRRTSQANYRTMDETEAMQQPELGFSPDGSPSSSYDETERTRKNARWRDLIAYWLFGLTNNYGYVVMLSAAHDILQHEFNYSGDTKMADVQRECNTMSTGAILLADILPALTIKLIAPFLPTFVHVRVFVCIVFAASGFLLVAFAPYEWVALSGVVVTSLSSGLGEVTFLTYSSHYHKQSKESKLSRLALFQIFLIFGLVGGGPLVFLSDVSSTTAVDIITVGVAADKVSSLTAPRNVVSAWSSGTGGAGVIGSVSYAGLRALGLAPVTTLLVMLIVPVIMAAAFWLLLKHPEKLIGRTSAIVHEATDSQDDIVATGGKQPIRNRQFVDTFGDKLRYMIPLLKYMVPLGLVYLFEYFINQGLFELVNFEGIWLDHSSQYRWLQVLYQVGVFISRSSVNIVQINHIWVLAVLQLINVVFFSFEVVYYFVPSIWIVFALTLWEGLLGGGAYVNTFYKISKEVPPERREFSMGVTSLADSMGIAIAGWLAIPAHNALCHLPKPTRPSLF